MEKQDYIYTDKSGYKIRIVSLVPNKPQRVLLIPPLVGATGVLAIRTFRYFFREGCILMSFDYCGHYDKIDNEFTVKATFTDTEIALNHANEYAKKIGVPVHMVGTCYGLIPLIYVMDKLEWNSNIKSMFSVSGLLNMDDLLNFNIYKEHLKKRGEKFEKKAKFIKYMEDNKEEFISKKEIYVEAMSECLLKVFKELADVITTESFGVLQYSKAKYYESFYEFMTIKLPDIVIPKKFPCLFFTGIHDMVFNLRAQKNKTDYLTRLKRMAPHAKFNNIRIDHFGRGEDHYVIGVEGMKFLIESEKNSSFENC